MGYLQNFTSRTTRTEQRSKFIRRVLIKRFIGTLKITNDENNLQKLLKTIDFHMPEIKRNIETRTFE